MAQRGSTLGFLVQCAAFGLAAAFIVSLLAPNAGARLRGWLGLEGASSTVSAAATALNAAAPVTSYANAVQRAGPSVVSVYVDKIVTERVLLPPSGLSIFTRTPSGMPVSIPRQRLQRAQGSGVLVSDDGYILTNHHVANGAREIQIVLWDGRVTPAKLVGSDPDTDLALLKIDGSNLPAMPLETSSPPRVGDVALAIGNPFGLGQTVTQGIVSGVGRNQFVLNGAEGAAQPSAMVDFIQTDAAINSGNSGGALIDAHGNLIGINTFIFGRMSMDAEGIGFAVPASTALEVFKEIRDHGAVLRGWMGAEYGDAPIVPETMLGDGSRGVALTGIYNASPAANAGLRPGDVLLKLDGVDIIDQFDLRNRESNLSPGDTITLSGLRAGVPFETQLRLMARPTTRATR